MDRLDRLDSDLALVGFHVQDAELPRQGGGFWVAQGSKARQSLPVVVAKPLSGCRHSCIAHVQVLQECNS